MAPWWFAPAALLVVYVGGPLLLVLLARYGAWVFFDE